MERGWEGAEVGVKSLGKHLIVEFFGVDSKILDDKELLEKLFVEAARRAGSTVCGVFFHRFKPQGVAGVVVVSESHLSIHTWPEYGYAAMDIFVCGAADPWAAFHYCVDVLKPKTYNVVEVKRGILHHER